MPNRHIGLLGGSFNPAHAGHRFISLQALKSLGLDQVWWLVSPQNPLKAVDGMADFTTRLQYAAEIARHPRILVSDFEQQVGTRYSIDTVRRMQQHYRGTKFVWLIGADNFIQMPRWRFWQQLLGTVPVAVYDRSPLAYPALRGVAASRFWQNRHRADRRLVHRSPPAWAYLFGRTHPQSATAIRRERPDFFSDSTETSP